MKEITLTGGDCGGQVHQDATWQLGEIKSFDYVEDGVVVRTLMYRLDADDMAVFVGVA